MYSIDRNKSKSTTGVIRRLHKRISRKGCARWGKDSRRGEASKNKKYIAITKSKKERKDN